ncbi:hypothetical protein [Paenibacillus rigui]|uniref:Uncharacterized protein n=1 Tax=Paenibacillus rigui TaxID=554312 RepID=A0A229UJK7_9BACL|nr:hypothetical protein [Paenibacillus rigui]OXM83561.1 hypothetical protein CF651_24955 [Paenibacillus rigui]
MPWSYKVPYLLGKPVGISLKNGQGVSGVLCSVYDGQVYVMEYLYHTQFATKHYPVNAIQDMNPFPSSYMPPPPPMPYPQPRPFRS